MTITAERLEEWKVLAEKATEGPWVWDDDENMYGEGGQRSADNFWPEAIIQTDSGYYGPNADDRAFIAAARTAVPALIAEVERLRGLVHRLSDALTDEGPDWSNDGVARLRDQAARALPDVEWLQPYRSALQETPSIKE